ncbi:MAG TPA: hypothetical protein VNS79_03955 [Sphingobium sp.]|nr:hypothetical protein [Sphingobium sp.]
MSLADRQESRDRIWTAAAGEHDQACRRAETWPDDGDMFVKGMAVATPVSVVLWWAIIALTRGGF